MMPFTIRDAREDDFDRILALNTESVHFLSPLDKPGLQRLHAQAAYHRVVDNDGTVSAFLLAFREGAAYDSPNFLWFTTHYSRFLYVDRIVVASDSRESGFGGYLYDDIIEFAAASDAERLTCEFDIDPPKPASAKFHARYGFREVGQQWIRDGTKQVSLQSRSVQHDMPIHASPRDIA